MASRSGEAVVCSERDLRGRMSCKEIVGYSTVGDELLKVIRSFGLTRIW